MPLQGKQLRAAILLLLDEHHRADPSRTVEDTEMAQPLNAPIEEIRRQLDILAEQGYTNEANTFGGHSAYIAPKGMAMADELREAAAQGVPGQAIGFQIAPLKHRGHKGSSLRATQDSAITSKQPALSR